MLQAATASTTLMVPSKTPTPSSNSRNNSSMATVPAMSNLELLSRAMADMVSSSPIIPLT